MANPKPVLDVQNLTKRFGAKVLFENISFAIAEGQRVGLDCPKRDGEVYAVVYTDGRRG